MSTAATIAEFDLELHRTVKRLLAAGVPRQSVMLLLIDHAHEAAQTGPGRPQAKRRSRAAGRAAAAQPVRRS